jgi:hypothetical protein
MRTPLFFTPLATVRYRQNNIDRLTLLDGSEVFFFDGSEVVDHEAKAAFLWHSFKDGIGKSIESAIPSEI